MKLKRNEILGILLVVILSFLNIFSIYLSEFIITITIEYKGLIMYPSLEIISRAINFTYLGLVIFIIFYFFIYKNQGGDKK
ncbi:hypothetical protein ACSXEW_16740 (plasmid) [Clostridium perfringens]